MAAIAGCRRDDATQPPTHASASPTHELCLLGVDVLDPRTGNVRKSQDMWLGDGVVGAIDPAGSRPASNAVEAIELAGKTVIPGLFDMHGHLPDAEPDDAYSTEHYLAMQLAAGVTGVRSMRGTADQVALRSRIRAGEVAGPDLWVGGLLSEAGVDTVERGVRQLADNGFDFVKVLGDFDAEAYRVLADTAADEGLALAGHVPPRVPLADVLARGQCIEHLQGFVAIGANTPQANAVEDLIASDCFSCPTMDYMRVLFGLREPDSFPKRHGVQWVGAAQRERWESWQKARAVTPEQRSMAESWLEQALRIVARLDAEGAPLLASASHGPWIVPGFGLLEELKLLEAAGLDRLAILRSATSTPALWLGDAGRGHLEVGATADLVVLDGSPLDDLQALREPHAVIRDGQYRAGEDLRRSLAVSAESA